jgi:glycosyltransferase involved in cell wall biosynthesis
MTADTVGGVWTYAVELARALGAEGVEVVLATMGGPASAEQRSEARAIPTLQLYESTYRLPWMDQPWEDVELAGNWLLDLMATVRPDVVHLNEPVHASLPWSVPCVAVAHSCVLSWWQSVRQSPAPEDWDHYRKMMGRGLAHATEVVAPSAWMLETLRHNYGLASGRVIPNGRTAGEFVPGTKTPLVFAAGRLWDPAKNLLVLDQVAEGLPWPVYLAGDCRHPNGDSTITSTHVQLLGRLPARAVAGWLQSASIYAFPARYEPFGLSVLEAALAGCTLVLGDIPTLRELWEGAAIFVAPDHPKTLRIALEGLIGDPGLCQALSMRARKRALTLTPSRMAKAYLGLYTDLLTHPNLHAEEAACAS